MAGHLVRAGFPLVVHSRTRQRAEKLLKEGAEWAETPAELASRSEIVFSIVGGPADVQSVHLGPQGTLHARTLPRVLVDMTTSSPDLAQRIAREATALGVGALDAPVSGGDVGARNGTLTIMCGGTQQDFDQVQPIMTHMGKTIVLQGGAGAGQHTKIVNQILIAGVMLGIGEALSYSARAGLDSTRVMESVASGAAGSWALANLAPRALKGDFAPGFFVEHFVKDLGIALDESQRLNMDLSMIALAKQTYARLAAQGHARAGTQAIVHAYAP